jgi:hypothetical protein
VAHDEGHLLRRAVHGGDDQVALVLAAVVVHDDDDLAALEGADGFDDLSSGRRHGGRLTPPAPQHQVQISGSRSRRKAADQQSMKPLACQLARKSLSGGFAALSHLVAPARVGERFVIDALCRQSIRIAGVKHQPDIGIVGHKRGWLETAHLVCLAQRSCNRQAGIERRHAFRIESAAIKFCAASRQRLAGVDGVQGAVEIAAINHPQACTPASTASM